MDTRAQLARLMDRTQELPLRLSTLEALALAGDEAAIGPLGVLLTEAEPHFVPHVRAALMVMSATRYFTDLVSDRRAPLEARVDALRALGPLKDPDALPTLLQALEDESARLRELAAQAILSFRTDLAQLSLERHLTRDPEPAVRMACAQALAALDNAPALSSLRKALAQEADGFVRVIIEISLHRAERRLHKPEVEAQAPRRQPRRTGS